MTVSLIPLQNPLSCLNSQNDHIIKTMLRHCLIITISLFLAACTPTIKSIGKLGPNELPVYEVSHNDFFASSRMLVVLNKEGTVVAATGGTVSGPGTVGLQAAGTAATAGAMVYGANRIARGAENAAVQIKGIPSKVELQGNGVVIH